MGRVLTNRKIKIIKIFLHGSILITVLKMGLCSHAADTRDQHEHQTSLSTLKSLS